MLYVVTQAYHLSAIDRTTIETGVVFSPAGPAQAIDLFKEKMKKDRCPLIDDGKLMMSRAEPLSRLLAETISKEALDA